MKITVPFSLLLVSLRWGVAFNKMYNRSLKGNSLLNGKPQMKWHGRMGGGGVRGGSVEPPRRSTTCCKRA